MNVVDKYLHNVSSKYGAPMGRRDNRDGELLGRPVVVKVPFVDGAYDIGGAYWGTPDNLWMVFGDGVDNEFVAYFRANTPEAAHSLSGADLTSISPDSVRPGIIAWDRDENTLVLFPDMVAWVVVSDYIDAATRESIWYQFENGDDNEDELRFLIPSEVLPTRAIVDKATAVVSQFMKHAAVAGAKLTVERNKRRLGYDLYHSQAGDGVGLWLDEWGEDGEMMHDIATAISMIDPFVEKSDDMWLLT